MFYSWNKTYQTLVKSTLIRIIYIPYKYRHYLLPLWVPKFELELSIPTYHTYLIGNIGGYKYRIPRGILRYLKQ